MAAAPDDAILKADGISVRFDTPEGAVIAVDDVSFTVRPGEFLSVIVSLDAPICCVMPPASPPATFA